MKQVITMWVILMGISVALAFWFFMGNVPPAPETGQGLKNRVLDALTGSPAAFIMPGCALFITVLNVIAKAPNLKDLMNEQTPGKQSVIPTLSVIFGPLIILAIQLSLVLVSLRIVEWDFVMQAVAVIGIGTFLLIGNYVATAKRGSAGSFNTPWTNRSDVVYAKTQRFLGRCLVVISLAGLTALLFYSEGDIVYMAFFASLIGVKLLSFVYSRHAWRQLDGGHAEHRGV